MKKIYLLLLFILGFSVVYAQSYQELYRYLVDLEGWKGEQPEGSEITAMYGRIITAERIYEKENSSLDVSIIKSPMASSMFAPFSMIQEVDTPEEHVKVFKLNGFPVGITHRKKEKSGEITVLLGEAGIFSLQYTNLSEKETVNILKKFPLKEIAEKLNKL
ncbi:hypothetical protein [Persephonella sp.]